MMNLRMQEMLKKGEAFDVRQIGEEISNWPNHFKLARFTENVDYCDADAEAWIWSIGKNRKTGEIIASTTVDLYANDDYECLFLR